MEIIIDEAKHAKKIAKSKYKAIDRSTRSTAPLPENIKSLIPDGIEFEVAPGEADVAIAREDQEAIVISGDSDLLYSSGPRYVAIPVREGKTFSFIVRSTFNLLIFLFSFMTKLIFQKLLV